MTLLHRGRLALILTAWLGGGCTAVHPVLRDLASTEGLGSPRGRSSTDWASRLRTGVAEGRLKTVIEGDNWVFAGGLQSGAYTDIEWAIDKDRGMDPDWVPTLTIGRLREPLPGVTLEEQAASLGFVLAKGIVTYKMEVHGGPGTNMGVMVRSLEVTSTLAQAALPEVEVFRGTTNQLFYLLTSGDRVTAVVTMDRFGFHEDGRVQQTSGNRYIFKNCSELTDQLLLARKQGGTALALEFARQRQLDTLPNEELRSVIASIQDDAEDEATRVSQGLALRDEEERVRVATSLAAVAQVKDRIDSVRGALKVLEYEDLERRWEALRVAYHSLMGLDPAAAAELNQALWGLQVDAVLALFEAANDAEASGLTATAAVFHWSEARLSRMPLTVRSLSDAVRRPGKNQLERAQYVFAALALELLPTIEGIENGTVKPTAWMTRLLNGWEEFSTLAKGPNAFVVMVTVGNWKDLRTSSIARIKRQSRYKGRGAVANEAGLSEWRRQMASVQEIIDDIDGVQPMAEDRPATYESGQEGVYGGTGRPGQQVEIGRRAYNRETKASVERGRKYAEARSAFEKRGRENAKSRAEMVERLDYLRKHPPEQKAMGEVDLVWNYEEKCQTWTGVWSRTLTIDGTQLEQTFPETSRLCQIEADPLHNVRAASELEGPSTLKLMETAGWEIAGRVRPFVQKRTEAIIEERIAALRRKGVPSQSLKLESALLRAIFIDATSPGLGSILSE